jgi:hypothetical protein
MFYTVSENSNQLSFELTREKSNLLESLDVQISTVESSKEHIKNYFDSYKKSQMNEIIDNQNSLVFSSEKENNFSKSFITVPSNISLAIPNEDFVPIKEIIQFLPGESTKVKYFSKESKRKVSLTEIFFLQFK